MAKAKKTKKTKKSGSSSRRKAAAAAPTSGIHTEAKARTESASVKMRSKQLGEILLKKGSVTDAQLVKAIKYQRKNGGLIGQILRKMGACDKEVIAAALRKQFRIPEIDLAQIELEPEVLGLISQEMCVEYGLLPFEQLGKMLCLSMKNCLNRKAIKEIETLTSCKVKPFNGTAGQIDEAIELYYAAFESGEFSAEDIEVIEDDDVALEVLEVEEVPEGMEGLPVIDIDGDGATSKPAKKSKKKTTKKKASGKIGRSSMRIEAAKKGFSGSSMRAIRERLAKKKAEEDAAESASRLSERMPLAVADVGVEETLGEEVIAVLPTAIPVAIAIDDSEIIPICEVIEHTEDAEVVDEDITPPAGAAEDWVGPDIDLATSEEAISIDDDEFKSLIDDAEKELVNEWTLNYVSEGPIEAWPAG